jgi:hypothetical protein
MECAMKIKESIFDLFGLVCGAILILLVWIATV